MGRRAVQLMVLGSSGTPSRRWLRVQTREAAQRQLRVGARRQAWLSRTPWRIEVGTTSRRVPVRRAGKLVRRFRAFVGAPGTPTPPGLFAVAERFDRGRPNDFYGPPTCFA